MTEHCKYISNLLSCPHEVITRANDEEELLEKFYKLQEKGKKENFTPVFIIPSDVLAESFQIFLEDNELEETSSGMSKGIEATLKKSSTIDVQRFLKLRRDDYTENSNPIQLAGNFLEIEPTDIITLCDHDDRIYPEIILAQIPTSAPNVAAWVPMGGFNDCPSPEEQVSVFKYFNEKYGVMPAVVTYDAWQVTVDKPILTNELAEEAAWEHFAFCEDLITQAPKQFANIKGLASTLKGSTAWEFWWD